MSVQLPITLKLPYPLSANLYWRPVPIKAKKADGGHFMRSAIVRTEEANQFIEEIGWRLRAYGFSAPLDGRLTAILRLWPKRPQDWATRQRKLGDLWDDDVRCIDRGNATKVLWDAFNRIVWHDDKQVWCESVIRMEPDGEARCEVVLSRFVRTAEPQLDLLGGLVA